jgi:lysophospholipid acyltransferase (LPLAT)-like uncharacterized protein
VTPEGTIPRAPPGEPDPTPPEEPRRRPLLRRLRHALRPLVARPLLALGLAVLPRLYTAYMWFVWKTSRVEDFGFPGLAVEILDAHGGFVGVLWHEEVFSVAWAWRGIHGHTLASPGDAGEVITRMLERGGFVVFRGGSSRRGSRRREGVLEDMIAHMKTTDRVPYGITVDGSRGPYHVLKRGAVVIARECRMPMVIARSWARRNLRLPTWDRMAIPLPFNHIRQYMRGPYWVPEGADDPQVFEEFRARLEADLRALAEESLAF